MTRVHRFARGHRSTTLALLLTLGALLLSVPDNNGTRSDGDGNQ
jgi:hypothetical protein